MLPEFRIPRYDVAGVWENYLSNDDYCVIVTPTGRGLSFYRYLAFFQVSAGGRAVYLRDLGGGRAWALNHEPPHPGRAGIVEDLHPLVLTQDFQRAGGDPFLPLAAAAGGFDEYECIHGAGFTRITSVFGGIAASLEIVVPVEGAGELWEIEIENRSGADREIAVMPTIGLLLGGGTAMLGNYPTFNAVRWDAKEGAFSATNTGIRYWGLPNLHATLAASERPEGMASTRDGCRRAVLEGLAPNDLASGEPVQVLLVNRMELGPGEKRSAAYALATGEEADETRERALRWARRGEFRRARSAVDAWWGDLLGRVRIDVPDAAFGDFVNGWLQVELVTCARWTRGGGERGYRDVLQDAWALAPLRPEKARELIVDAIAHQYRSGFAPRSYPPVPGPPPGTRRASDSALWIPFALGGYLRETGDTGLLDEMVGFLDGGERAAVIEHASRAVSQGFDDRGEHGIPRFREGDWNDGLDGAGVAGRGESVWLGMCLAMAAEELAALHRLRNDDTSARQAMAIARETRAAVEHHGWDGEHYLQGWNDRGEVIGSRGSAEGRIFLLPQAWALLGGFGDEARRASLRAAVERDLATTIGPRLLHPAFTRRDPGIGRVTARVPGTSDNAGVQTHAAVMMAAGYLRAGCAREGYETLRAVTPMNPSRVRDIRETPPFVLNSQTIGPDNRRFGATAIGWLTGAAGWMFRTSCEQLVGVRPETSGLRIDPRVPADWKHFAMRRIFRDAWYEIAFNNTSGTSSGIRSIQVDGHTIEGTLIAPQDRGRTVKVIVEMG